MNMPNMDIFVPVSLKNLDSFNKDEAIASYIGAMTKVKPDFAMPAEESEEHSTLMNRVIQVCAGDVSDVVEAFATGKYHGIYGKTIKDVLKTSDYPKLFGTAAEIFIKNRIIPNRIVLDNLFTTIPYTGTAQQVTIRTFGGVEIGEVPEGGPYPETSAAVQDQSFRINLEIKKYGAKVVATRELIESDNWGLFGYTLSQLGVEIMNYKERMAVTMLNEMCGYVLKDNLNAASAELGSTSGRGVDSAQNGALGIDDIFEIIAWMAMRGYNIDTILVHPFAWGLWASTPSIREVMLDGGVTYLPSGTAAQGWDPMPWGSLGQPYSRYGAGVPNSPTGSYPVDPIFGKLGVAPYNFPTLTPFGATYQIAPKYIGKPVKVLVSPFVPFWKATTGNRNGKYITNIIFADSSKCGLVLEKEAPTLEQWQDIEREIDFVKIRTKFGMAMQDQGRGVAVAKNIVIDRTFIFDNVNSQTLSSLTTNSNLISGY
jgi:hypothetical protein